MLTGSWLAYGEILRNSAIGAARFFNKATMRLHVVRIATTGKDGMIEITGRGLQKGITGPGLIMTTNKGAPRSRNGPWHAAQQRGEIQNAKECQRVSRTASSHQIALPIRRPSQLRCAAIGHGRLPSLLQSLET
jgi:hypothetical protein